MPGDRLAVTKTRSESSPWLKRFALHRLARALAAPLLVVALHSGCVTHKTWRSHIALGETALSYGEFATARSELEMALSTAKELPTYVRGFRRDVYVLETLRMLVDLEVRAERWDEAEQYLKGMRVLFASPLAYSASIRFYSFVRPDRQFYELERSVLTHLGDTQAAARAQERVLELLPPDREATAVRMEMEAAFGIDLERAGFHEEAIAVFERAKRLDPYTFDASSIATVRTLRAYGDALEAVDRPDEAIEARARALEVLEQSDYVECVLLGNEFQAIAAYFPPVRMPLRVRIERPEDEVADPAEAVRLAKAAFGEWEDSVSPGVPSFQFTETREYDIRVAFVEDRNFRIPFAGRDLSIAEWGDEPLKRSEVVVVSRLGDTYLAGALIATTLVHEIGHALGLIGHSDFEEDVMFPTLTGMVHPMKPSERDLRTLRRLYRVPLGEGLRAS